MQEFNYINCEQYQEIDGERHRGAFVKGVNAAEDGDSREKCPYDPYPDRMGMATSNWYKYWHLGFSLATEFMEAQAKTVKPAQPDLFTPEQSQRLDKLNEKVDHLMKMANQNLLMLGRLMSTIQGEEEDTTQTPSE